MLFRFHRGGLAESMETVISVNTFDKLENIIYKNFPECINEKITFKYCGYDNRTSWDTYYVCLDGKCIGMSNSDNFEKIKDIKVE